MDTKGIAEWYVEAKAEYEREQAEKAKAEALAEEHRRLRDAVVEAAVDEHREHDCHKCGWITARAEREALTRLAVQVLLAFERLHGLRERD